MNALGNPGVIPVSYLVDNADNIDKVFVGDADESELRRRIEKLVEKD
jgi:thioredoxin-like negative regulator of GroEL